MMNIYGILTICESAGSSRVSGKNYLTDSSLYSINLGRGRRLPRKSEGTLVHRSVLVRVSGDEDYRKGMHKDLKSLTNANVVWCVRFCDACIVESA